MEEVHRQTCQDCGSRKMRNLLVREHGEHDKVFVQCCDCRKLVARYILAHGGYYHAGKDYESYLRGLMRDGEAMSGRRYKQEFNRIQDKAEEKFHTVVRILEETGRDD